MTTAIDDPSMSALDLIAAHAWAVYRAVQAETWLVTPSIPILFFGDYAAYVRSRVRVLTVGLNPSDAEFPRDAPFARFPTATMANDKLTPAYFVALSAYFRTRPYRWFGAFEPVLQGLNASYYGRAPHTTLHTDLCSPLATRPTWTGLSPAVRDRLRTDGVALWHALVAQLRPQVIILSVAWEHTAKIGFTPLEGWHEVLTIRLKKDGTPRKTPYQVLARRVQITDDAAALLVFGQAANTPFGTVSTGDKQRIGARVRELLPVR